MTPSEVFARAVALVGGTMVVIRKAQDGARTPAFGQAPAIPTAKPQGKLPTLKVPAAQGWAPGQLPTVAPGLKVNALATGLDHPRWIEVLPNGDVLVAESRSVPGPTRTIYELAMRVTMQKASAMGVSANRITRLRDADGDGVAEVSEPFLTGLNQPFGMALVGDTFYVGNTDGVMSYSFDRTTWSASGPAKRITTFKPGGHWTRSLLLSPDNTKLYAGVGSLSNIADRGADNEIGRACIYEIDLATGSSRIFGSGLRNAVGMAWEPVTGALWTVVNERDGLGDETPPDYLTSVVDGGFYGWPYSYWDRTVDDRVPQDPAAVANSIKPDYALGGHTASLGLCWHPAGTLPGFPDGMIIGQHGSWNRSTLSGYKVIFVPFANGQPSGPPRDILSDFLSKDEKASYGRPVGVTLTPQGALLVADDVGNCIWRVTAA